MAVIFVPLLPAVSPDRRPEGRRRMRERLLPVRDGESRSREPSCSASQPRVYIGRPSKTPMKSENESHEQGRRNRGGGQGGRAVAQRVASNQPANASTDRTATRKYSEEERAGSSPALDF